MLTFFIPLLPKGSFFTNWNAIIFWTVFSINCYLINKYKNKKIMDNNLNFIAIFFIFLLILNYILIKFDFCIDRTLKKDSHKLLLRLNHPVPLSGTIYFISITFLSFLNFDNLFLLIFISFFVIGLLSDLNITNSPKLRLFMQFMILLFFLYNNKSIIIDTRIEF